MSNKKKLPRAPHTASIPPRGGASPTPRGMKQDDAFEEFHEALKLDPDELEHARLFPYKVRDALKAGGVSIDHSFLQGSLARGTMVSPFKDIDMIATLDVEEHGDLRDHAEGTDLAMDLAEKALGKHLAEDYPELTFPDRTRHALQISLGENLPSFDLVLGFEVSDDKVGDVEIANRDDGTWDTSNPRELKRAISNRNKTCAGKFIHVVRMVKAGVKTRFHTDFPGLVVESIAFYALSSVEDHASACARALEQGGQLLGGPILEPTGRDDLAPRIDHIAPNLTANAKLWFTDAGKKAQRALDLAAEEDHDAAIDLWCGIFGEPFPCPESKEAVASVAHDLSFGTLAARPTRSWRSH